MKNIQKLLLLSVFMFSGCSYFTFNATMCDNIHSDPHNMMSEECRVYREEEAQKAFDKADKNTSDIGKIIEFNKIIENNNTSQSKNSDIIEFNKE